MENQKHLPNRKQLISEIEAELNMTISEWEWTDEEIEDMHYNLVGHSEMRSMGLNGPIRWNLRE